MRTRNYKTMQHKDILDCAEVLISVTPEKQALIERAVDKMQAETWRQYHSLENHIIPMLREIVKKRDDYTDIQLHAYLMAAIYHDVVYDVRIKGGVNEKDSAMFWKRACQDFNCYQESFVDFVADIIIATYGHESTEPLIRGFLKLDLSGFNKGLKFALEQEKLLRKEFDVFDWDDYKNGTIAFLSSYLDNTVINEMGVRGILEGEIEYIDFLTPNIAIYPGSFNPYHVGHEDVLRQARNIFDKVIIAIGQNADKKKNTFKVPKALEHSQVDTYSGLLTDYIKTKKYPVTIIRGLRNGADLAYEQNQLKWLKEIEGFNSSLEALFTNSSKIKTVAIFANPKFEHVSSSAIRSLMKYNKKLAESYIVK